MLELARQHRPGRLLRAAAHHRRLEQLPEVQQPARSTRCSSRRATEVDQNKRKDLYDQAAKMIVDDVSYLYLYNPDVVQAWAPGPEGLQDPRRPGDQLRGRDAALTRYLLRRAGQSRRRADRGERSSCSPWSTSSPATRCGWRWAPASTQGTYDALRHRDRPGPAAARSSTFTWAGHALTGDLGVSFRSGEPVTALIARAAAGHADARVRRDRGRPGDRRSRWASLSALHPRSPIDRVATVISQIGISVPDFWLAIVLILVFAGTLGWLPVGRLRAADEDPLGWLQRLLLPAVAAGVVSGSVITRFVRSSVLEALGAGPRPDGAGEGAAARGRCSAGTCCATRCCRWSRSPASSWPTCCRGWSSWRSSSPGRGSGSCPCRRCRPATTRCCRARSCCSRVVFLVINLVVDLLYTGIDPRIRR